MLWAGHDCSIRNTPFPSWTVCRPVDPGWLYVIRNGDLFKVGKTTHPKRRLREAGTWLPTGDVVGVKPFFNVHVYERVLLCGIANFWIDGEWHQFPDSSYFDFLVGGFQMFDDHDRNKNTVDFGYWINGSGMDEVIREHNIRRISLRKWQQEA